MPRQNGSDRLSSHQKAMREGMLRHSTVAIARMLPVGPVGGWIICRQSRIESVRFSAVGGQECYTVSRSHAFLGIGMQPRQLQRSVRRDRVGGPAARAARGEHQHAQNSRHGIPPRAAAPVHFRCCCPPHKPLNRVCEPGGFRCGWQPDTECAAGLCAQRAMPLRPRAACQRAAAPGGRRWPASGRSRP